MQRRIESKTRGERIVEHVVWNAAAGAALAVMVLVLLCSLQWLDQLAPSAVSAGPAAESDGLVRSTDAERGQPREVAAVNRPSG